MENSSAGLTKADAADILHEVLKFRETELDSMKEIKRLSLAFTYVGCFLGAGFVSGQELWQFFGSFGNWGYLGFVVAAALFVTFGVLLVRITQMSGIDEMDRVLVPWNIPWLRKATGVIEALFLLGVVIIMTAGVGAMLNQLLNIPTWLGDGLFAAVVALIAILGVSGMVSAFSALVPMLVVATLLFAVAAFCRFGVGDVLTLEMVNTNPLMPNWFVAALTYVAYNMLGAIGIVTPVGKLVEKKSTVFSGMAIAGLMLMGVAGSILTSLAVFRPAAQAELPMVALATELSSFLGGCYGVLLLFGMFCNALASLVALVVYLEHKWEMLKPRRKPLLAVLAVLVWLGSLGGFGDLIGVIFPVFGYISIFYLGCLVVHYVQCCRREKEKTV